MDEKLFYVEITSTSQNGNATFSVKATSRDVAILKAGQEAGHRGLDIIDSTHVKVTKESDFR
jgi:hypothetical protein